MFKQKLLSTTLVFALLSFLQGFVSLLLQPFYTAHFGRSDYALFSMFNNLSNLWTVLSVVGVANTVMSFYYDYADDETQLSVFFGQLLSFLLVVGSFSTVLLLLVGDYLFQWWFVDAAFHFYPLGAMSAVSGVLLSIIAAYVALQRNQQYLGRFAVYMLLWVGSTVLGQIIGIVYWKNDVVFGALLGRLVGNVLGVLMVLWRYEPYIRLSWQWTYLRLPLRLGIRLLPALSLAWFVSTGDRFLMERWLSLPLLGIYSLLNVLGGVVDMGMSAFRMALLPHLHSAVQAVGSSGEGVGSSRSLEQLYESYVAVSVVLVSGVLLLVSHLHWVVGSAQYLAVQSYIYVYLVGFLVIALHDLVAFRFLYQKNTYPQLRGAVLFVVANVVLNYVFTPVCGLWGMVAAAVLARVAVLLLQWQCYAAHFRPFISARSFVLLWATVLGLLVGQGLYYYGHWSAAGAGSSVVAGMWLLLLLLYQKMLANWWRVFRFRYLYVLL